METLRGVPVRIHYARNTAGTQVFFSAGARGTKQRIFLLSKRRKTGIITAEYDTFEKRDDESGRDKQC